MSNKFSISDHTFAVCAYGASCYLDDCITSLLNQTVKPNIVIATSTPNETINEIGRAYNIPIFVNNESNGIGSDWNFAASCVKTSLVTIAHQDDIYKPTYLNDILDGLNKAKDPLIAFTDYGEFRQKEVDASTLLSVKRLLLKPLSIHSLSHLRFIKRLSISFGNPICCPSVTYVRGNLSSPLFHDGFRSNLDWDAWERFSNIEGSFVYISKIGMLHRIHEDSETSSCIRDNVREKEDLQMLKRFWPGWMAKMINKFYVNAQGSNQV